VNRYKLSKAADRDLDNILDYGIDQFGLEQAVHFSEPSAKTKI